MNVNFDDVTNAVSTLPSCHCLSTV